MADVAVRGAMPTKKAPSPVIEAAREASITVVLVFLLSIYMVGFKTQAEQGQPLSFVTQFSDVIWACILVPVGRFLIALNRLGKSQPALIGGAIGFIYLSVLGATGLFEPAENPSLDAIYTSLPFPYEQPMVNVIFGLGAAFIFGTAISSRRALRHGAMTVAAREAREERRAHWARRMSGILGPALIIIAIVLPGLIYISPWSNNTRQVVETLILILTYVMLGWGLNIVVGLAGLLDLGYVAFYAVGAYTYAKFSIDFGFGFWECLPIAGLLAATFGVVLGFPVLRLRGDYLAIVTLGFGEMIRIVLINWQVFTGGPNGLGNLSKITFFGLPFDRKAPEGQDTFATFFNLDFSTIHRSIFLYYVILVLALITNFVTIRLRKLPIGRAWEALREDETACRALGINPTNTKLTAFAIGAMFAGFAGSFFATRQGFVSPESFVFIESAQILAIVVLGGMGSQVGVALAAILLVGLPEVMRELSLYRMLFYGMCMVMIMLLRPRGLLAHREPTIALDPKHAPSATGATARGVKS
ncbi:high-affinity branched-chain amino acid ABC transporter permease LivM [Dongia sp. agr-C8]